MTQQMTLMSLHTSSTSRKSHEATSSHTSVISKAFTPFWRSFNVISCTMILHATEWSKLLQLSNLLKNHLKTSKILQHGLKECIHEVLCHFNIIWFDFIPPAAKQELPVIVKLQTLFRKRKHTVGLKIPLECSILNFRPFQRRLAQNAKVVFSARKSRSFQ